MNNASLTSPNPSASALKMAEPAKREAEEEKARAQPCREPTPPWVPEKARDQRHRHGREDDPIENQAMLEVKEDDLHQDEDEQAAQEKDRLRADVKGENAEEQRCEDGRPEDLPAPVARLEAFEARQAH